MRRRALLISAGVGLFSGCIGRLETFLETEQTPSDSTQPTPNDTPTNDGNEPSGPAEFEVRGIEAPAEVEVSEPFDIEVTVENTGGETGEYNGTVMVVPEDGEQRGLAQIQIEITPNETSTATVEGISIPIITTETYQVEGTEVSTEVAATAASRSIGETFRMWNDLVISVDSVLLESDGNDQVAFVTVTAENQSQQEQLIPYSDDFVLYAGDESFTPDYGEGSDSEWYEGERIQSGTMASGYIAYLVPGDVTEEDIAVEMTVGFAQGDVVVEWS